MCIKFSYAAVHSDGNFMFVMSLQSGKESNITQRFRVLNPKQKHSTKVERSPRNASSADVTGDCRGQRRRRAVYHVPLECPLVSIRPVHVSGAAGIIIERRNQSPTVSLNPNDHRILRHE